MLLLNERLKTALGKFGLPVSDGVYGGEETKYIAFNYNAIKTGFGDDKAEHVKYQIQVHLYAPAGDDLVQLRVNMKQGLYKAGFEYPDETNVSDEKGQHIVFEMEEIGWIDYGKT